MPRHSPYRIVLSPRERAALESRARQYTLPYFQVVRARMILLAAEGRGNDEIAAALSIGRDGRQSLAQAILRATPGRPRRTPTPGSAPGFSPQNSSSRLKRSRVNCRRRSACRSPG